MTNYADKLKCIVDNQYLISMVPVDELLRIGYELGLDKNSRVLDLCCGYGTLLKIWSEAFGISGTGVDRCKELLHTGKKRLKESGVDHIMLEHGDVTKYCDSTKYDVVICSETIGSIENTFKLGEKFLKDGGTLLFQKVYSLTENVPEELSEFDGGVYPISKLNKRFNSLGYYITNLATGTENDWNRYHTSSVRSDLEKIRKNPKDIKQKNRLDKWNDMHFMYRMPFENQAMFCLEKI